MASPDEPAPQTFPDDPPVARIARKVDTYVGIGEQFVLVGLGLFLMFVLLLWLGTEHLAEKPLENATADVLYTTYLMAMIGGAYAAHHRRLLAMDVINRMVGARPRAWLRVVTTATAAFITLVFFWYAWKLYLAESKRQDPEHWMPDDAGKIAMAAGAFLLLFHLVVQIVIDLAYLARGKTPPEPEMGAV